MANAKIQTVENSNSVEAFINSVPDEQKRKDSFAIIEIMKSVSGHEPKMWGPAIVGFGKYHYQYESGREGDAPLAGFSPRKGDLTLYFSSQYEGRDELLAQLGKHKTAKVCLYIKKLDDIKIPILKKMIKNSIKAVKMKHK